VFCSQHESIQHLCFNCHFAKFLWRAIQATFNIDVPTSVAHVCNGWATGLGNHFRNLVLVGMTALVWALWTSRNDIVLKNSPNKTYTDSIPRNILATTMGSATKT
jgi:hypothetical protein